MDKTKRLYQQNMYLKQALCKIIEIQGNSVILDQTVFYPEGGGQPCDLGKIGEFDVLNVSEKEGIIYHDVDLRQTPFLYTPGTEVLCTINWDRRFDHMQNHCGEHILSGIFFRRFGGINRGFRLGSDSITIDIDFSGTDHADIKADDLDAASIEMEANEIIWSNTSVSIRYFAQREDAEGLPLRKPLAIEEDISIVCVGEESNPSDCVACCGTHPRSAGEVGLIKLLRLVNYKGMVRVHFKCGKRALEDYRLKHDLIGALKVRYSAKEDTLLDMLAAKDEKTNSMRRELAELKKPKGDTLRSMLNHADRA